MNKVAGIMGKDQRLAQSGVTRLALSQSEIINKVPNKDLGVIQ